MIAFSCPHCGHSIKIDPKFAGRNGKCAACGKKITVPAAVGSAPAEPLQPASESSDGVDDLLADLGLDQPAAQSARSAEPPPVTASSQGLQPDSPEPVLTRSPLNLQACRDCGELVSIRALVCPHCGCPFEKQRKSLPSVEPRYRTLRALSRLYGVGGIILALIGLLVGVFGVQAMISDAPEIGVIRIMWMLYLFGAAITFLAISQGIRVFLDIEENTWVIRSVLEQQHAP